MKFCLFDTMRTCFLMLSVLFAVFFVSMSVVRAELVTFQYEGELTHVDSLLEGQFLVGDSFAGFYTFDSDSPETGGVSDIGFFFYGNAISDMTFSSDGFTGSAVKGDVSEDLQDGFYSNAVDFDEVSISPIAGFVPDWMQLAWEFSSASVPDGVPSHNPNSFLITHPGFDPVYSQHDENMRFRFSGAQDQVSFITGRLNSVSLVNNVPSITVLDNTWVQIGLSMEPPAGSTVADIIGDDISALYNAKWVIYSYQTSTNTYKKLSLTDTMLPGIGYWLIQITGSPITIDMPISSTRVSVTHNLGCAVAEGCFEITLPGNVSGAQWQMIGYPFPESRNMDNVTIATNHGICSSGCTLSEASAEGLVGGSIWHFQDTAYEQLTTGGSESFDPWDGAWIATLPAANGMAAKLFIPAAN